MKQQCGGVEDVRGAAPRYSESGTTCSPTPGTVAREKGISMGKLHRQADVSYKTIKRIYSDPFYATTTITIGKLAKVLGVPPGELIEEVPDDIEESNK